MGNSRRSRIQQDLLDGVKAFKKKRLHHMQVKVNLMIRGFDFRACFDALIHDIPKPFFHVFELHEQHVLRRFAQDDSTDIPRSMCGDHSGLEELPSTSSTSTVSSPSDVSGVSSATSDRLQRLIAQLKLVPKSLESTSNVGSTTTTNDVVDLVSEPEDVPAPNAALPPSERLRQFLKSRKAPIRVEKQAKSINQKDDLKVATPESPDVPEFATRCWNLQFAHHEF